MATEPEAQAALIRGLLMGAGFRVRPSVKQKERMWEWTFSAERVAIEVRVGVWAEGFVAFKEL